MASKEVINLIKESKKIVVFTEAGISTNCGIPDFRSSDGLYNFIDNFYELPYPEAIFDLNYFIENPNPFFQLARNMFASYPSPTRCHEFVSWLEEKVKVILVVTQNSDMLHHLVVSRNIIECHGTFRTAHCMMCDSEYQFSDIVYDE